MFAVIVLTVVCNSYITDMARQFYSEHNVLVDLDINALGAARVSRILMFLARSRIHYAVTESPLISESILSQFWENIQHDFTVTPPVLKTRVYNRPVIFSATHLRDILHLGSVEQENGPTCYPREFILGALARMGYVGSQFRRGFNKGFVYGQWRFLFHVMITVFGSRQDTVDELDSKLLSALLSLVYNKPFSFSKYLFGELCKQVQASSYSSFLLYPRFCMLIIRHCLPDLPLVSADLSVDVLNWRVYDSMFRGSALRDIESLQRRPLFGHLVHSQYVAPPGNAFDDYDVYTSTSDDEDIDPMFPENNQQDDLEMIPSPVHTSTSPIEGAASPPGFLSISARIEHLESKVQELDDLVQVHSEDRLQVWNTLSLQNRAYSMLVQIHRDDAAEKQRQIDELRVLLNRVLQSLPSQGEIGSTSRRPDM